MRLDELPLLTVLIVLPVLGAAVVWALPRAARARARTVAVGVSLLEVAVAAVAASTAWACCWCCSPSC
jgi:NADH-quinone oxidoreductase subunit M